MKGARSFRCTVSAAGICAYLFIYVPILMVVVLSFFPNVFGVVDYRHVTLTWYNQLFNNSELLDSFTTSLKVALPAVGISLLVGTYAAILLQTVKARTGGLLVLLLAIPYLMPGIVTGVALSLLFRETGIPSTLITVTIGQTLIITPCTYFLVRTRLRQLDPALRYAALDLGASEWRVVRDILLPNVATALLGAALLSFVIAFDEIVVSFFLVGSDQTLPVKVWTLLRFGYTPQINALYSIIFVTSLALILIAVKLSRVRTPSTSRQARLRRRRNADLLEDRESSLEKSTAA